ACRSGSAKTRADRVKKARANSESAVFMANSPFVVRRVLLQALIEKVRALGKRRHRPARGHRRSGGCGRGRDVPTLWTCGGCRGRAGNVSTSFVETFTPTPPAPCAPP